MIFKLVSACLILALLQVAGANPKDQSNYLEQESSCKDVCALCDCEGFYCEDECICECDIEAEENLQCIADMKTECDKNGLEYEILMQDSAKERFLRQVGAYSNPFSDFNKNFVIMKTKREPSPTPEPQKSSSDPVVGAANPNSSPSKPTSSKSADAESDNVDPIVGSSNPSAAEEEKPQLLGMPLAGKMAAGATKAAIAGAGTKFAFKGLAAKTAVATLPVKTVAAKASLAGGLAMAGLGTKMKANKMLFTLGSPKSQDDSVPDPPKPATLPDWSAFKWSPVLGAAKKTDPVAPPPASPTPAPPSPSKPKFFSFGPVQPEGLYDR